MKRRDFLTAAFAAPMAAGVAAAQSVAEPEFQIVPRPREITGDPDLHFFEDGRGLRKVFIDGVEAPDATKANTREGWAEVALKDNSKMFFSEDGEVVTEILRGKVTVEYI